MTTKVPVVENILNANDRVAEGNRIRLAESQTYSLNLMASPGAGKTSLIEKTLPRLSDKYQIAVIDGDIATSIDADRAAAAGAQAVQINTGGQCHLDAPMLSQGLDQLKLEELDLLIVENVGNLICPSSFQLGTRMNVLIASIPEGDDKPYKYPPMFRGVQALIINKVDLLPYIDFDMDYFQRGVEALNPGLMSFPLSCRTEEGIEAWTAWLSEQIQKTSA